MHPRRRQAQIGSALFIASMAVAGAACGGSSSSGSKSSEVSDLAGAALQRSDAPSGYNQRFSKIYKRYTASMATGGKLSNTCSTPKPITSKNWQQALAAQLVKGSGFSAHTVVQCAWLLKSDSDAHAAYQQELASTKGTKGIKTLSVPKVGDEQTSLGGTASGITGYATLFRHRNALMVLGYSALGKGDVSLHDFGNLIVNVNSRLK